MIKNKLITLTVLGFCMFLVNCREQSLKTSPQKDNVRAVSQTRESWDDNLDEYRQSWPEKFGIGHAASGAEIEKWDIDVGPDGRGLPIKGAGRATAGALLYAAKCAYCHGQKGYEGPYDKLVKDNTGRNTIGNYWPYATTIYDYVRRAMPFNEPGSLSDQEVYDITAYLLFLNGIIEKDYVIDHKSLPAVKMPARDRFVVDDRKGGNEIK